MPNKEKDMESAIINDEDSYGTKIKSTPVPPKQIGIDTEDVFTDNLLDAADINKVDISAINAFSTISQTRDTLYEMLDTMAEDSMVNAILETYSEDATERNEKGQIVWCQSSDAYIAKYVTYLLNSMNVDKNIYKWVYSLCKYGDVYLRLYRESEFKDALLVEEEEDENKEKSQQRSLTEALNELNKKEEEKILKEDININIYHPNDKYVHYLEMVPNPAEMFELTKFGKTYAYIQANVSNSQSKNTDSMMNAVYRYSFKKQDINIYNAATFVHACLEDNTSRVPEEVDIFLPIPKNNNEKYKNLNKETKLTYSVKRGQSLLYNSYKIWRELKLLENALLLNRITKSSVIRIVGVEVGDMDKTQVGPTLARIKQLMEQKSAINTGKSFSEYTNPGPMENNIYVPIREGGKGNISIQSLGGDIDVKGLSDIDYFNNLFFGGLRVPKQYFGCLRGNTSILLLNGKKITVEEMFNNKNEFIGKGIMACNEDGSLQPTIITNIMLTKPSASFLRIHLDNGEYVDVTNDHRMMLRDGTFVFAEELEIGDSLMPYYDYIKDGRRYVLDNKSGKIKPQYRVVAESVCDIPKGYQVHHKNSIKIDDDFDNLVPLTVAEHYAEHKDMLHKANRIALTKRRERGEKMIHQGNRMINNGIIQCWLPENKELPEGFTYGMLPFTQEHKDAISRATLGKKKNRTAPGVKPTPEQNEKHKKTLAERKEMGLYDEVFKRRSETMKIAAKNKTGWHSQESYDKKMSHVPENRRNKERYVRCPVCGTIEKIKCNDDWYNEYLNKDVLWFCCSDCYKVSGGGKLARSYKLYVECNYNDELYEYTRWNLDDIRPDSFFKVETLKERLAIADLDSYVPECNHKVVDIEFIDVDEPAYDISVAADCHTFALPCGIFVHNCTDDFAGFSGGESLALISSRYAKMVKRIQNTIIQALTDAINLMLLDKGLDSYINKFELQMVSPTTTEEKDRMDTLSTRINSIRDTMDLLADIDDPVIRLKITKELLSNVINDEEIISLLEDEIDKLEIANDESGASEEADFGFDDLGGEGSLPSSSLGDFGSSDLGGDIDDLGAEDSSTTDNAPDNTLPSPADLGQDFTDNTSEF